MNMESFKPKPSSNEGKDRPSSLGEEVKKTLGHLAEGAREGVAEGARKKIEEYATRIRNGETKEKVFEGAPPSLIAAVEKELESELEKVQIHEKLVLNNEQIEEAVDDYFNRKGEPQNIDSDSEMRFKKAVSERYEKIKKLKEVPKNIEYAKRILSGEKNVVNGLSKDIIFAIRYLVAELRTGHKNNRETQESKTQMTEKQEIAAQITSAFESMGDMRPATQKKAEEYARRIGDGENPESIYKDLNPHMIKLVKDILGNRK